MSDNKRKKKQDAKLIAITDPSEVRYACKVYGCSRADLMAAVSRVGASRAAVRCELAGVVGPRALRRAVLSFERIIAGGQVRVRSLQSVADHCRLALSLASKR